MFCNIFLFFFCYDFKLFFKVPFDALVKIDIRLWYLINLVKKDFRVVKYENLIIYLNIKFGNQRTI